jgi:hypothetical protein
MKKTGWYPGNVKPVHVGVYETAPRNNFRFFQFWNGEYWGCSKLTPRGAHESRDVRSSHQRDAWRGLTAPAK